MATRGLFLKISIPRHRAFKSSSALKKYNNPRRVSEEYLRKWIYRIPALPYRVINFWICLLSPVRITQQPIQVYLRSTENIKHPSTYHSFPLILLVLHRVIFVLHVPLVNSSFAKWIRA